jgi:hypothetical protein
MTPTQVSAGALCPPSAAIAKADIGRDPQAPDMGKPRHRWRRGSHEDFFRQVKIFSFSTYLSIKRTTLTPHME